MRSLSAWNCATIAFIAATGCEPVTNDDATGMSLRSLRMAFPGFSLQVLLLFSELYQASPKRKPIQCGQYASLSFCGR
jgi:hypothetical protein